MKGVIYVTPMKTAKEQKELEQETRKRESTITPV